MLACGSQMGKTDLLLDVIGSRLDQRPVPILYAGPSRDFVSKQFEPRIASLLEQSKSLRGKLSSDRRQTQTRKVVAGVPLRLAHAGSSTALKSDPAGLALVDEYDEMLANIKGQGDPLGLVEARGFTYSGFVTAVTSTPSQGTVETVIDEATKLEFWKSAAPEEIASPIWKLWQEGTRFHWAWQCPHCSEWFIPRWRLLQIPKGASPAEAKRKAFLACPCNGCAITDEHKAAMNARGVYVAPGQSIAADGTVIGDPPESPTISFWVSGLASPFVTFGSRAEAYVLAFNSGETDKVQTAINAGAGEVYIAGGGDVPDVAEVESRRQAYRSGTVPDGGLRLTMAVDVQRDRLIYGVRAWGRGETSWLVRYDEIFGDTAQKEVWAELEQVIKAGVDGMRIEIAFVDSGFRPGDPKTIDVNRVYEFVRSRSPVVYPTKGALTLASPLLKTQIEVTSRGSKSKYGLALIRLSTDHWKMAVYNAIRRDMDEDGAFFLPDDISAEYCGQVVSEARKITPLGRPQWVRRQRENHALDIEAMNFAAAYMRGFHRLRGAAKRRPTETPIVVPAGTPMPPPSPPPRGISALARLNRGGGLK